MVSSAAINIKDQTDQQITPCLEFGELSENAKGFVASARNLGENSFASTLRAWCVLHLFHTLETLLEAEKDPIKGINTALETLTEFLTAAQKSGFDFIKSKDESAFANDENADVKDITGDHYGNLFKTFSDSSYKDEPVKLLKQRLERNGIKIADIKNKKTLDAGCGGGRYSIAWRLLGSSPVTGLDISPINIEDANRRVREAEIGNMFFKEGNVLEIPFADEEFDIVFSNGVLHHTTDWKKGVQELVRVLRTGGLGWLYLIENPGGIFWDIIEILRLVMKDEEKSKARAALQILNIPANRIFYMLDHVMVPINLRLTCEEIEECLKNAGAINIRRLKRGSDIDRIEHIYNNTKYSETYFGKGENRYIFSK